MTTVRESAMQVDLPQVRAMLGAMGYVCAGLDDVADIPTPVLHALAAAWKSVLRGDVQYWEIELIATRMREAAMA